VLYDLDEYSSSAVPNTILNPTDSQQTRNPIGRASQSKLKLEDLAARELPARLGMRYTDIVLLCLRCLGTGGGTDQDGRGSAQVL
jgi:hypothetical protein